MSLYLEVFPLKSLFKLGLPLLFIALTALPVLSGCAAVLPEPHSAAREPIPDFVIVHTNGLSAYPEPSGAFPHVGGLTYSFAAEAEPGSRSSGWLVGEQPLDPEARYLLVTTDFLLAGGDNYEMLKGKRVLFEYGTLDELLADYMAEQYLFEDSAGSD